MDVVNVTIDEIEDEKELVRIGHYANTTIEVVENFVTTYQSFVEFPFLQGELKEDGFVHLCLSKDPNEPEIKLSPANWNNLVIHLRDEYFPEMKKKIELIRNEAVFKASKILNAKTNA